MVKPKNIVNVMILIPEYFNNWLNINDFKYKRHSLRNDNVILESKSFRAIINNTPMCRIESKVDPDIIFVFKIPRERSKFYELIEIVGKTLGLTVTQDVA